MKSFAILLLVGLAAVAAAPENPVSHKEGPALETPTGVQAPEFKRDKRGFLGVSFYGGLAPHYYGGGYDGGYHGGYHRGYHGGYRGYHYAPHYDTPHHYYRSYPQYGYGNHYYHY